MDETIWKMIFIIMGGVFATLIRRPHIKKYKKTEKITSKKPSREKFLMFLAAIGMMVMPVIYVFTPWLNSFSINLPEWARWSGVVVFGLYLFLFWWVHKTLGTNWSPVLEIRKDHKLITEGPYKYVRHPMYTCIWLAVAGFGLISSNWVVGIVAPVTWGILYFIRLPDEEKMMIEEFGDQYKEYMRRTKRIIPWVY